MSKGGIENKHARVANSLGIDSDTMKNHPYGLEVGKSGPLLVRWHEQAPDEVIREGRLGSYATHIRPGNDSGTRIFVEKGVRRYQSC